MLGKARPGLTLYLREGLYPSLPVLIIGPFFIPEMHSYERRSFAGKVKENDIGWTKTTKNKINSNRKIWNW